MCLVSRYTYYSASDNAAEYCGDRVCLSVCLSVCPRACSRTTRPIFTKFLYILPMSVARSSSGGVAIRYVLPVLRMTSSLYIIARNRRRSSDSVGSSVDLSPWRILKLTQQGAAPDRGRSLISTFAVLICCDVRTCTGRRKTDCLGCSNESNCGEFFMQWRNQ